MTDATQNAPVASPKKKGQNVEISFTTTPSGYRIMHMKMKHNGALHTVNLGDLLASHPDVAMQIFEMGAKTIAANCVNTTIAAAGNTAEDGEAALLARLDAWQNGRYTAGVRTGGIPLFILAFERALTKLGKSAEEIAVRTAKVLSEYRLEGDALSPDLIALRTQIDSFDADDEEGAKEALKLFRKHQTAVRNRFVGKDGNPLVKAAMDEIAEERAKPGKPVDIEAL